MDKVFDCASLSNIHMRIQSLPEVSNQSVLNVEKEEEETKRK